MIIERFVDEKKIKSLGLPLLVYGRRKTGKTFLIKRMFKNGEYFFVRKDKSIYYERRKENINLKELIRIIDDTKKTVIVDEFHRLGDEFLEYLHIKQPKNIILVTSTLNLAKKLISSNSPILGLFLEFKMNLIDERDIIRNLKNKYEGKKLIENCVYLREPLLLRFFKGELDLNALKLTVPALVGEIFEEEEKNLSARYEGILRAIACGKNNLSEIVAYLYSLGLIKKQDTSMIKQYLKNLIQIGLIKRTKDYYKNKYYYFIESPMIDLYYYLDEKYNFSETDLDKKYFKEKLPKHTEAFFRTLLAKVLNKREFMISKPNLEVDIVLGDFNKLKLVGEVKWKNKISKEEIKKTEEKLNKFPCEKILIVPTKKNIKYKSKTLKILDVKDILKKL